MTYLEYWTCLVINIILFLFLQSLRGYTPAECSWQPQPTATMHSQGMLLSTPVIATTQTI